MTSQLIDLRDLVNGLGTGKDDAALWMKGIAKVPDNAAIYLPPLAYQFKTPCVISKRKGVRLVSHCIPQPDGDYGCPRIRWAGSTGERVFFLDRCDHCELDGLSVELDASGTAYIAVDFDDDGPGMSSANALRRFRVHALRDNANYVMIRISENARANHEYYEFENIQLSGGAGANGPGDGMSQGVGLKIAGVSGQSKNHQFRGLCTFNALGTAIWQVNGSFSADNISCWNSEIDIRRDNATEAQRVKINTEHSRQTLVDTSGSPWEFSAGSRFGPQWTALGKGYFQPGMLFHMQGASVDDHVPSGSTLFDFSKTGRRATLISNAFASNTTVAELGLATMPLDRSLVMISNHNVIGLPDFWVRGGRARVELGWYGDGDFNLLELAGHALAGTPRLAGLATQFDSVPDVQATCIPRTVTDGQ